MSSLLYVLGVVWMFENSYTKHQSQQHMPYDITKETVSLTIGDIHQTIFCSAIWLSGLFSWRRHWFTSKRQFSWCVSKWSIQGHFQHKNDIITWQRPILCVEMSMWTIQNNPLSNSMYIVAQDVWAGQILQWLENLISVASITTSVRGTGWDLLNIFHT